MTARWCRISFSILHKIKPDKQREIDALIL